MFANHENAKQQSNITQQRKVHTKSSGIQGMQPHNITGLVGIIYQQNPYYSLKTDIASLQLNPISSGVTRVQMKPGQLPSSKLGLLIIMIILI